jgi:hypothetical protein
MNEFQLQVERPFRVKRNLIVKAGELERAVVQAISSRNDVACILVVVDADDDCPAELGPALLKRCQAVTTLPVAVVLANKEFECWFLGAKESLRGVCGIRADAASVSQPEAIMGAKHHVSENMVGDRRYVAADDQAVLSARMDIDMARRSCPSFDKLVRDIATLIHR